MTGTGWDDFRQRSVMMLASQSIPNEEPSGHPVEETTGAV